MADAASNDSLGGAPPDAIEEVFTAHEQQQQTDEATALSADASPDR